MATKHSNWRDDLREVVDSGSEDQNDNEIREKKVKNKIDINPSIREAVAELGGQLIDMREESEVTPEYVKKKKDILRNIMDTIRQNRNRCRALGSKSGAFVNEGNCKCSGCAPDGVGHQNPCVECGGHHKDKLSERLETFRGSHAERRKEKLEDNIKRSNARMKYGKVAGDPDSRIGRKTYDKWQSDVKASLAKNKLRPGEVKRYDNVHQKWVSNKN